MTIKLLFGVPAGILGAGTMSAASTYGATLTTIKDYLKDDLLGEESEVGVDWTELQKVLNGASDIDKYSNSELIAARTADQSNPSDGNAIKEWCKKQQELKISPYFKFLNKNLVEAVENFCIRTIESKLGNSKIDLEKGESHFKIKFNSLNNHDESQNGKLDGYLKDLKKKKKSPEEGWKDLRDWCKKIYRRGYQKETDNHWKLAQHYCKISLYYGNS